MKDMLITVLIPVYNSVQTIAGLAEKLIRVLGHKELQIILVNDGSNDNSHAVCCQLFKEYPAIITYINLSKNFGEHNAIMAGLNYAKGEYVVIMHDDFQHPPEEVPLLIREAKNKQCDIVYTYFKRKQHHWLRNIGSRFNNWVANAMLDKPKDLYLSSFKCLSRFIVQEIIKYKGPFPYIDGLALRSTRNIAKIQVSHEKRQKGRSGYTFRKMVREWLNMWLNFSIVPLRMSSLLGLIFCLLGIFLSLGVIIDKFLHPQTPIGWPSLVIVIMVFSGAQLLILGLLGEYIGHLFLDNNQTPQFVVRQIYKET